MRVAAVAAAALSLTAAACRSDSAPAHKPLPPDRAAELLHERIWLDHLPRSPADKFHLAIFDDGGSAIAMHRTVWKGDFEVFFYDVDGRDLEFFLPASGTEMRSAFHIEKVSGPENADVKLVIEHPPTGPREYLGFAGDGGAIDQAAADAWLADRFPR